MFAALTSYFNEFRSLRHASREFWLTTAIQFFEGLAYFSTITILTHYLTTNCGFNDVESGAWVGFYTLFITAFIFAVGPICDVIGIKKSFFIGISLITITRLGMGLAPAWLSGSPMQWSVKVLILAMSLGTAFMSPVMKTALRRYTTREERPKGFNVYYLIMNIGAFIANAIVVDGCRKTLGEYQGNLAICFVGFVAALCALVCVLFMREHNYADEAERLDTSKPAKRPLAVFLDVWKEPTFRKLLFFLVLTLGVRLVFTNQFLVMPKYYTRVLYDDFELGAANSINPIIIVIGLALLIPIINRFDTMKLMIVGMGVSALSLCVMALPMPWVMAALGTKDLTTAYLVVIITQIVIFAIGELIFSPRWTEFIASVAPPDKVSSYMALSSLPLFFAKPINGFISGLLISHYCYDGIRAKIDSGLVPYTQSPEFMWLIYLVLAVTSPVAIYMLRGKLAMRRHDPSEGGVA